MTIARIWKATVIEGRAPEYETFARDISLPMFRQQDGFEGVAMMRNGNECTVLTFWRDEEAIRRLDQSESYLATVNSILAVGFLESTEDAVLSSLHLAELGPMSDR
ncbi:antibiotic biosynthesis monooxygenase family protein [Erythrobacter mangrovi]|uniref:Antibiotic biosynthesis monooxygenase n=1 Tax=Erythrobacter mangrovi TaxID=2739433 RepID=A0A7D3XXN4_9SPHN|nr:antibiotic biosynthesis monooxygenase [Erythrobacter mangrovi]QKG72556.1 antibiotic biosynthesis monooxygenase [Erythrobacter mangrovi]